MIRSSRVAWAAALVLAMLQGARASEPAASSPPPAPAVDDEEQVDEGLKRFGYLAGLARGCVAEGQRTDLEREALELHAAIARLLGTDRAFLFSAAFGYGTTEQVETGECAEVLETYDERVARFRAGRGEQK